MNAVRIRFRASISSRKFALRNLHFHFRLFAQFPLLSTSIIFCSVFNVFHDPVIIHRNTERRKSCGRFIKTIFEELCALQKKFSRN
eukprot:UN24820